MYIDFFSSVCVLEFPKHFWCVHSVWCLFVYRCNVYSPCLRKTYEYSFHQLIVVCQVFQTICEYPSVVIGHFMKQLPYWYASYIWHLWTVTFILLVYTIAELPICINRCLSTRQFLDSLYGLPNTLQCVTWGPYFLPQCVMFVIYAGQN